MTALTPASSAVREVRVTTTKRRVKKSIGGREVKASGPRGANGRKFIKALVTMHTKEIDSDRLNCIVKTDQLGSLFATLRPLRRRSGDVKASIKKLLQLISSLLGPV